MQIHDCLKEGLEYRAGPLKQGVSSNGKSYNMQQDVLFIICVEWECGGYDLILV